MRDYYGGDRLGDNLYGDSIVAINAISGKKIWHFQMIHHDLWDRDIPAQPTLVRLVRDGKNIDAVAQITKTGYVYLFNRESGKALFPIDELEVPSSNVPGEFASDTQPIPRLPRPFARQTLNEDSLTHRSAAARKAVLNMFKSLKNCGPFCAPSTQGTILFPGMDGGAEWGGASFDPETSILYVNSNDVPWIVRLKKTTNKENTSSADLYNNLCSGCHKKNLEGSKSSPSLVGLKHRMSVLDVVNQIYYGSEQMPRFSNLDYSQYIAIAKYVLYGKNIEDIGRSKATNAPAYRLEKFSRFLDPDGYPAIAPPWGTLNAINLNSGKYVWSVPLGEYPELSKKGVPSTGSENYGGSVVTAGGLVFIGATQYDHKFHAFDKYSGKLLWETILPNTASATPAIYQVAGEPYVLIVAGGSKFSDNKGGNAKYIAFSIPNLRENLKGNRDIP